VVLGDSVAEGWVDPLDGYPTMAWADRVAAELAAACPQLVYFNLGQSNRRASHVRIGQLRARVGVRTRSRVGGLWWDRRADRDLRALTRWTPN